MKRAIASFALVLAACSTGAASEASHASASAIVAGDADVGDPAVVAIGPRRVHCDDVLAPFCSGIVIAPRVVLTAAHCFEGKRPGEPYEVFLGDDVAKGGELHGVERVVLPSAYDGGNGAGDLAVLILDSAASATPAKRGTLSSGDVGKTVKLAGFGVTGDGGGIGTKRFGTGKITSVKSGAFEIGPAPSMTCQGDSGGPLLLPQGGGERLVGITSFGDPGCATFADNARIDVAAAFLDDAIASVADAGTGPDADAGADAGAGAGAAPNICSGSCTTAAQCGSGFDCNVSDDGTGICSLAGMAPGDLGASCATDDVCPSHICARFGSAAAACACLTPCVAIPPKPDAALPPSDASIDVPAPPDNGGCSCRTSTNPTRSDTSGLALDVSALVGLLAIARRRRRVSGCRRATDA